MSSWHSKPLPRLLEELDARPGGLSQHQAEERLRRTGPNELEPPPQAGLLGRLLEQMRDPMILVLLGAAGLSLAASGGEEWLDAAIILVIVAVNSVISIFQEDRAQHALEELRSGKDCVAVHVEAPDECTHNGDLPGKLQAIEWLDSRVVGPLTQALAEEGTDYRLLILSDHKTLTATRGHDADPVPYLLYDSRKDTGLGLPYCEESGQKGPAYPAGAPVLMKKLFAL